MRFYRYVLDQPNGYDPFGQGVTYIWEVWIGSCCFQIAYVWRKK